MRGFYYIEVTLMGLTTQKYQNLIIFFFLMQLIVVDIRKMSPLLRLWFFNVRNHQLILKLKILNCIKFQRLYVDLTNNKKKTEETKQNHYYFCVLLFVFSPFQRYSFANTTMFKLFIIRNTFVGTLTVLQPHGMLKNKLKSNLIVWTNVCNYKTNSIISTLKKKKRNEQ